MPEGDGRTAAPNKPVLVDQRKRGVPPTFQNKNKSIERAFYFFSDSDAVKSAQSLTQGLDIQALEVNDWGVEKRPKK